MDALVQPFSVPIPISLADDPDFIVYDQEIKRLFELYYRETYWTDTEATDDITTSSTTILPIRREHIICTNTSSITVTLNDGSSLNTPFEDQQVLVTRNGTGAVTVSGGANNIIGASTYIISTQHDSPHFKWSDITGEWLVI